MAAAAVAGGGEGAAVVMVVQPGERNAYDQQVRLPGTVSSLVWIDVWLAGSGGCCCWTCPLNHMLLWWVSCLGLHAAAIDARIPCGECPLWWCCWRVVLVLRVGDCGRRSALAAILTIVAAALQYLYSCCSTSCCCQCTCSRQQQWCQTDWKATVGSMDNGECGVCAAEHHLIARTILV